LLWTLLLLLLLLLSISAKIDEYPGRWCGFCSIIMAVVNGGNRIFLVVGWCFLFLFFRREVSTSKVAVKAGRVLFFSVHFSSRFFRPRTVL